MTAQMTQMIVSIGKSANRVTMPTSTAAIVAPTSGMRSAMPTSTASGPANGMPRIFMTMKPVMPALGALGWLQGYGTADPAAAVGDHEDRQDEDRHAGEDRVDHPHADVGERAR